ncbi:serine hydrolase domain-containing protein [Aquimarina litoralis]|uniref:serine hydrolase domain-containing protein n=1 Tax=Aquimarina litoralis TaxID=584605 RepID=UPI001C55B8E5|nr:serine hydrolase domain-containing protein [Aquimarina litoralis]MBW1294785.1 serine hydrolase [Aquimarina litoralis]
MHKFLVISSISILLFSCKTNSNNLSEQVLDPIEYSMSNSAKLILENPEINSISIGIYKNGETYTNYYGEIDKGKNNKANDNSIFEIASVTKTFTAYITAQAVLEGKLNLDDDIRIYLDGSYNNLKFDDRPILIKDILTHTTGIQREHFSKTLAKMFSIDITENERKTISGYSKKDFIKDLATYELKIKPGKKYDYSGFVAPEILGMILENIYEKSYAQLLKEQILDEAQMSRTSMQISDHDQKHLLNGYTNNNQLVKPLQTPLTGAGGGLKSTVPDMLRYIKFLLENSDPILKEMRKPLFYDEEEEDQYGYFWMVQGEDLLMHNGGTGGNVNWLILLPKINSGFTVSFNYNGDNANDLINTIASLLINDLISHPKKNAYYLIRNNINKKPENWVKKYQELKENNGSAYNFEDFSLLNDLGYELLEKNEIEKAIEVFQLLILEFPNSADAFDSLGEGYLTNNQYELSLINYKKSLELNPQNDNAQRMIQKIQEINKR